MALPALGAVARIVTSAGLWTAASRAFRGVIPKARSAFNSLSQNARAVLGLGAGGTAGFGLSEIFDRFGIEDSRIQTLSVIAVIGLVVFGIGQIFNVDVQA
jgi:hypothetical protein